MGGKQDSILPHLQGSMVFIKIQKGKGLRWSIGFKTQEPLYRFPFGCSLAVDIAMLLRSWKGNSKVT